MDGPIAVARFNLDESDEAEAREARVLRQREVNSVIQGLLVGTASATARR